jgi:hypothetical protein
MPFLEEKFSKAKEKDMESWFIEKIGFMKGNGSMILGKERVWKDIVMEINMKEIFIMVKLMEKEFIIGLMERSMMENGEMELRKVMECGEAFLVIHISVNGRIVRQMDMEYTNGKMETGMKVLGSIV